MPEKLWPKGPTEPSPQGDDAAELPPAAATEGEKPPDPMVQAIEEARTVEEPLIEKLRRQERPTTIGLEQNATMVELFDAIQRAAKKVSVAERESGRFRLHLWDNLTPADVAEIFRLEDRINAIKWKPPSEITDEDRKFLARTVIDFFESKGIAPEDVATHLPIKFRKKKKGERIF